MEKKILFAVTNQATKGDSGEPTGFYLSEVTHPWHVLSEAGFTIDFVSPQGGAAPAEAVDLSDPINAAFWNDPENRQRINETLAPHMVASEDYAAMFFAGGHGAMWDFPESAGLARLAAEIYGQGGVLGAVCHGPAGLINVRLGNGRYLVSGKRVNAFTNEEERAAGMDAVVPFLLEDKLRERGAVFEKSDRFTEHVALDERLVTGQNPQSATAVGEHMLRDMQKMRGNWPF